MNSESPTVTVIMACYNASQYMDESISSVLNQTFQDFELILVDDCSADNSLDVARKYAQLDRRVKVVSLPTNSGAAAARNAAMAIAQGDWICILDADDVALPDRLEKQMRLAGSRRDLVLIGGNSVSITSLGSEIKAHRYPASHRSLVKRLVPWRAFPPHSSMLYRASVVRDLRGFNSRFKIAEDLDLWLRMSEKGHVGAIRDVLVKIRKHDDNLSGAEGGVLSYKSAFAVFTCHLLREMGASDPSANPDGEIWQRFWQLVERRVEEDGVLEAGKAWKNVRNRCLSMRSRVSLGMHLGAAILKSSQVRRFLWDKYFGSSLPRRMAKEWVSIAESTMARAA